MNAVAIGCLLASTLLGQDAARPLREVIDKEGWNQVWSSKLQGGVAAMALSPDGSMLAVGRLNGNTSLFDLDSGKDLGLLVAKKQPMPKNVFGLAYMGHIGMLRATSFSPDGKLLASGGVAGGVELWEPKGKKLKTVLPATKGEVFALAFTPDNKQVIAAGELKSIVQYDVASGKRLGTLFQVEGKPNANGPTALGAQAVAVSPNGKLAVTFSQTIDPAAIQAAKLGDLRFPTRLHIIDLATKKVSWSSPPEPKSAPVQLAFSGDSGEVIIACVNGTVEVFDLDLKKTGVTFQPKEAMLGRFAQAFKSFSRDASVLAVGGKDGKVEFWDVRKGLPFQKFDAHKEEVVAVAFSGDGLTLATATGFITPGFAPPNQDPFAGIQGEVKVWKYRPSANANP